MYIIIECNSYYMLYVSLNCLSLIWTMQKIILTNENMLNLVRTEIVKQKRKKQIGGLVESAGHGTTTL